MLLDARTEKDEQVWWSAEQTSVYATGPSAAVETTGFAVQALLQSGEASGTARKALTYIASKKDACGTCGTTQTTIMAFRALLTRRKILEIVPGIASPQQLTDPSLETACYLFFFRRQPFEHHIVYPSAPV